MNVGVIDRAIRVVIAEDHTLMAEGLRKLLEGEFESVTTVGNGRELVDLVAASKPDLALVDIVMPLLNGIEATRRIGKISPATTVIILSAHADPQYVAEAFRAGASGYVLKRCSVSELVTAMRAVLAGETYVTELAKQPVEAVHESAPDPVLTPRQRDVLRLIAEGRTAKEIANALNMSVKTAVYHKMAIRDKLGLHSTAELTRYAMEHGIAETTHDVRAKSASVPR